MNPFELLGVPRNSSKAEINAAFRKKAKDCHPDLHPGDPSAPRRFRELEAARDAALKHAEGGTSTEAIGARRDTPFARHKAARRNLRRRVQVGVKSAFAGCTLELDAASGPCRGCKGEGFLHSKFVLSCETCSGTGVSGYNERGIMRVRVICNDCQGSGRTTRIRCVECGGLGTVSGSAATLTIPPGTRDGEIFVIPGGANDPAHGLLGDLEVTVSIAPEDGFRAVGADVEVDLVVEVWEAALGVEKVVEAPDGARLRLKIPAGSQHGRRFRAKGRELDSGRRPDFVTVLSVRIPDASSGKEKEAYERLRKALSS